MAFPDLDPVQVFRDFATDKVPTSGKWNPRKPDIRRLLKSYESAIIALIAGQGGDIDLARGVISFAVTGGTANDIIAEPDSELPESPGSAVFILGGIEKENTGAVTINNKSLLTNSGNQIVAGGLVAGGIYLFLDDGTSYRLLSDYTSSAIIAAAEAWAVGTEPGGPGTKSAKGWADSLGDFASNVAAAQQAAIDASTSAVAAEDAAQLAVAAMWTRALPRTSTQMFIMASRGEIVQDTLYHITDTEELVVGRTGSSWYLIASTVEDDIEFTWTPAEEFAGARIGLWLDAADDTTTFQNFSGSVPATANGDPVMRWEDKSGSAFHFARNGAQGVLNTGGINGKTVIEVNGINGVLQGVSTVLPMLNGADEVHIFSVGWHNPPSSNQMFHITRNGSTSLSRASLGTNAGRYSLVFNNLDTGVSNIIEGSSITSAPLIQEGRIDAAGGIARLYENGALASFGVVPPGDFPNTNAGAAFVFGSSPSLPMSGAVAEIVVYVGPINDDLRLKTYEYFHQKWGLPYASLDDDGFEMVTPGAWTWFNDPRVLRISEGHYAVGAVTRDGAITVTDLDGSVSTVTTLDPLLEVDDHDNPSFIKLSDGRLMAAYCGHNFPTMFVCKSVNPNDASAWAAPVDIAPQLARSTYAYANLFRTASGRIYLLHRAISGGVRTWHYSYSDDEGETWAQSVRMSVNEWAYTKFKQTGPNRIDIIVNDTHPRFSATNSTYHYYLLDTGGVVSFHGTDGTDLGAPPLASTSWTKIYDGAENGRSWVWDITVDGDGNPVATFAVFPGASDTGATDHRYYQARWSGSAWAHHEICTAGRNVPTSPTTEPFYSGGVITDPTNPNVVYCSRQVDDGGNISISGVHRLFKCTTSDGGATWSLQQIVSGYSKCFRPFIPEGGRDLFFVTGPYVGYTNYATSIGRVPI